MMKAGLWIDHKKAVIVTIQGDQVSKKVIRSDIEKRVRHSGGARSSTPYGPQDIASEKKRDERYDHHLKVYHRNIVDSIRKAESIYIFGPGEGKVELKKHIEKTAALSKNIAGVETSDKLSDAQIVSKVKRFFRFKES
ncbi:MAG: hypothetical protein JSW35_02035 [Deltaproteobacteria bacterium]|nr:MAG: hypothetical protein JSW35_02035 [Deltaproteobacteria bacterium]